MEQIRGWRWYRDYTVSIVQNTGLKALQRMNPERAHGVALRALRAGMVPKWSGPVPTILRTRVLGFDLAHPIGVAAGFDKNAEAVTPLLDAGFAFTEVGAVTPNPQPGNDGVRMVRLPVDKAAINRFGFNNDGMEAVRKRLIDRRRGGVVGVNLGANKDAEDRAADYGTVLRRLGAWVDFATVNVSSPNTEGLRDLQAREVLADLLTRTMMVRDETCSRVKLLVKISPDLTDEQIEDVAQVALETGIDGIVATNTTLSRTGLRDPGRGAQGGLSGAPLMMRSTKVLARLAARTEGRIVLVGVGGVSSGADAYAKIRAGASLVQLYTALAYAGPGLVQDIARDLARLLERDGFTSVAQAVGVDA